MSFLDKINANKDQTSQPATATTDVAALTTSETPALTTNEFVDTLQPKENPTLSARPDIQQAHAAIDNLLGNVQINTGIQNSQNTIPGSISTPIHQFGVVVDGMEQPGYYSTTKGKVKGRVAEIIGGRFFFPLNVADELKEELDKLVESKIYEKVEG